MPLCRVSPVQIFAVAALCFAAASAGAADTPSPVEGAHGAIKALIHKGIVAGDAEKKRYYTSYRGYRCHSTLEIAHEVKDIDWSLMTSVADFTDFAHAYGPVTRTDINGFRDSETDAKFWLPNDYSARQLAEAMRVLMNSCAPKAKTEPSTNSQ